MSLWNRFPSIAYLAVFIGVLGHGSSEFAAVVTGMAGPELSSWRFLLGGIGLVLLSLVTPGSRDLITPLREIPVRIVMLSIAGVTVGYLFFHWALDYATVPQVATMVTAVPIIVGLTNRYLHKEPFTPLKIITGAAALFGVALLLTDGYLLDLAKGGSTFIGVLMALACAIFVGGFTVAVKPIIIRYGALRITSLTTLVGGIGLWLLVGVAWGDWVNPATLLERPTEQWSAMLVLVLFNTVITQFCWIGGLAAVPDITRGSYLFFLKPVIAALLTWYFLSQPVTGFQLTAMLIICSAVFIEPVWSKIRSSH
ncbi:DMT family transporter [Marinobacter sp. ATCH36]|uniref:DMT family transporter n=1 Tax=Marinobacter sp. ATCH36 TaxID=2945106 RepID=UPI002021595D|nr:DMT family transporter [Marinobacter sp. ATCH36]MCL7945441.1 DMT family transporter [Marinobacter sp. ATCH36]